MVFSARTKVAQSYSTYLIHPPSSFPTLFFFKVILFQTKHTEPTPYIDFLPCLHGKQTDTYPSLLFSSLLFSSLLFSSLQTNIPSSFQASLNITSPAPFSYISVKLLFFPSPSLPFLSHWTIKRSEVPPYVQVELSLAGVFALQGSVC